jgi:hypothetical protein
MTTFADIAPTAGDQGNSFEWMWDINTGTDETPTWLNVPDITGLTPTPTPTMVPSTTYANKGNTSQTKVGESFTLAVQIKGVKDSTGEFQPELIALIEHADAKGDANTVGYRYYHATSAVLAYQGTAAVDWTRTNTDNASIEMFSFVLTGQGSREKIANPALVVV